KSRCSRRHVAVTFVCEEPEGAILATVQFGNVYRPPGRDAEFVANQLRRLTVVVLSPARFSHPVVAGRLKRRAMQLVGSALGGDDHGGGPRQLGGRDIVLHAELLDSVQAGRAAE